MGHSRHISDVLFLVPSEKEMKEGRSERKEGKKGRK